MLNFEEELEKFQPSMMLKKLKMLYTIIILPM